MTGNTLIGEENPMKSLILAGALLATGCLSQAGAAAFSTATFVCEVDGDPCAGGGTIQQLPEVNGLAGVKMYLNQPQVIAACDANGCGEEKESRVDLNVEGGRFSGTLPQGTLIPISWDFTLTPNSGDVELRQWVLEMRISTEQGINTIIQRSGTNFGQITGSANLTSFGFTDGQILNVRSRVEIVWRGFENDTMTVGIPASSMNFGAVPTSTDIPEPGSLALLLGGLGVLLGMRRACRRG
jgi:hypothetical protein